VRKLVTILLVVLAYSGVAQLPDSIAKIDTAVRADTINKDSLRAVVAIRDSISRDSVVRDSIQKLVVDRFFKKLDTTVYSQNPFFKFKNPVRQLVSERKWVGKESFFYAIVALLLFFALLRNAFARYMNDLFRIFFRTSLKQRQSREQLMGAPLPSLFFNILYTLSAALFITLLLQHSGRGGQYSFWLLFLYSIGGLLIIYAVKFVTLKLFGWVLKISEATDTYIFIVFTTNKIIGILLLPFIIGLAFMSQTPYEVMYTLSLMMLGVLFIYRFYLSYLSVYRQVRINFFHFIVYLAAFEIVPLLLINKLLVRFFW
jgi:hypothetical protein